MHSLAPLVARHRSDRAARLNAPRAYRVGPRPLPPHHHGGRRLSSRFAVRSRARKARVCEAATPDGRGGDQTRDQSGPLYGERGAERRREGEERREVAGREVCREGEDRWKMAGREGSQGRALIPHPSPPSTRADGGRHTTEEVPRAETKICRRRAAGTSNASATRSA